MKLLLHCCCGPCATGSLPQFVARGYAPFCYYNNPNIHPYREAQARREAFLKLMEIRDLPYAIVADYPLEKWLSRIADDPRNRCTYCYESRLEAAAAAAAARGFPRFSSTLLISPYQKHELVRAVGERMAQAHGVEFVYLDLREGFRAGQKQAGEMGLYMQKYCGCIYSEKERFYKGAAHE